VEAERTDPNSLLAWYQALIRLKKTNPAFAHGDNTMLDATNTKVLSWLRQTSGAPPVFISVNFTAESQSVSLTVPAGNEFTTLLKTPGGEPGDAGPIDRGKVSVSMQLGPYGVYIGEVQSRNITE
jgi:hypothetical protein